uniref:Uncharacterized protein n=1 Tax=Cacopsylla melanoneura TaxID=428564 RepID=A0A8D8YD24_9HEMI
MFRTRASFQLGLKSILYLFLALDFNEKVSSLSYSEIEFGCRFPTLNNYSYNITKGDNKENPVWSNLAMKSYAVDNFENIEKPLKNLFSEASIQNELSLFTE